MNFYELLILAKSGDDLANEKILAMYQPLLTKESVVDGVWDEDLYQELCIQLFLCIRKFRMCPVSSARSAFRGALSCIEKMLPERKPAAFLTICSFHNQRQELSSAVVFRLAPIRSRWASLDIWQVGIRNVRAF